ncbi:MAG TPA: hypothetical protein VFT95_11790 [Micromonosporaceae bacterium]|nr:hypothetical protein [Micromonosporaceae bacterium]
MVAGTELDELIVADGAAQRVAAGQPHHLPAGVAEAVLHHVLAVRRRRRRQSP